MRQNDPPLEPYKIGVAQVAEIGVNDALEIGMAYVSESHGSGARNVWDIDTYEILVTRKNSNAYLDQIARAAGEASVPAA